VNDIHEIASHGSADLNLDIFRLQHVETAQRPKLSAVGREEPKRLMFPIPPEIRDSCHRQHRKDVRQVFLIKDDYRCFAHRDLISFLNTVSHAIRHPNFERNTLINCGLNLAARHTKLRPIWLVDESHATHRTD